VGVPLIFVWPAGGCGRAPDLRLASGRVWAQWSGFYFRAMGLWARCIFFYAAILPCSRLTVFYSPYI